VSSSCKPITESAGTTSSSVRRTGGAGASTGGRSTRDEAVVDDSSRGAGSAAGTGDRSRESAGASTGVSSWLTGGRSLEGCRGGVSALASDGAACRAGRLGSTFRGFSTDASRVASSAFVALLAASGPAAAAGSAVVSGARRASVSLTGAASAGAGRPGSGPGIVADVDCGAGADVSAKYPAVAAAPSAAAAMVARTTALGAISQNSPAGNRARAVPVGEIELRRFPGRRPPSGATWLGQGCPRIPG
jgi:hypothetical protein